MALFFALFLGPAETWQDAYRLELADPTTATQLPAHPGDVGWFARENEQRHFDEVVSTAVRVGEAGDVEMACSVPNAAQDLRFRQATARVESAMSCTDRAGCGELAKAVHELRGACLDLSVWQAANAVDVEEELTEVTSIALSL